MKVTIELSDYEVKGIKKYLKSVDDIKRPNKADVQRFVAGEINGILSASSCAVSDYVQQERFKHEANG